MRPSLQSGQVRVPLGQVRSLAERLLRSFGYSAHASSFIAELLLYAQAGGNSQGVAKLLHDGTGSLRPPQHQVPARGSSNAAVDDKDQGEVEVEEPEEQEHVATADTAAASSLFDPPTCPPPSSRLRFSRDRKLAALIDGRGENGMIVMAHATHSAIARAHLHGVGVVGTRGTNTGTGAIGYYARWMAMRGLIGLVLSGSSPNVAPTGARERLLGTNPLAYGLPTAAARRRERNESDRGGPDNGREPRRRREEKHDDRGDEHDAEPVVFDMSTSAMSFWGVKQAAAAEQSLPENVALDTHGRPTTDPRRVHSILPVAGFKGFGLSLLVEALTGPFVGAAFADVRGDEESNWGNVVLALDPELLFGGGGGGGRQTVSDNIDALVQRIRAAVPDAQHDRVSLPGDRSAARRREVMRSGEMVMDASLLDALRRAAAAATTTTTATTRSRQNGQKRKRTTTSGGAGTASDEAS